MKLASAPSAQVLEINNCDKHAGAFHPGNKVPISVIIFKGQWPQNG